jgi:riboflavin kinase/FMN adenylyltransferase
LNPEYALKLITTNQEKIDILKNMGIKHVLMLRFSREMADLHALDFYNKLLIEKLGVKEIIIGYDHAFGRDREGGIELLQKLGAGNNIGIMRINEELAGTRAVSSTWIRDELAAGNVAFANKLLGWPYSITGYIVRGESRGGTLLGYPTANVQPNNEKKVLPSDGAYAVTVLLEGLPEKYGMLNIGTNPTFQGKRKTIEVNIFDFYADLYGKEITVRFHERIRGEKKFSGIDELKKQLGLDKKAAVDIFEKQ